MKQIERLARQLAAIAPDGPFTVTIGGAAAQHSDFDDYMLRSLPRIFAFVVGATLLMLFIAFRSYLLPVEAVLMNLLAVAAGNGAVVAIFQLGWLNGLVGLERPFAAIPLEVPHDDLLFELRALDGLRAVFVVSHPARVSPRSG